ncbi:BsuPI-related putative proteinase inhibitor [Natronorubrum texcoconense]|uniref:Intracellular proteinase inhibitor n=1 Tax=Natronorubrum texcoconense TaxID=1095776 RepID=A0A1G8XGX6_9EURY|nr:BsuPI-related putative proteinase inhibitor [Natronorubrum texcoconense]SDJ89879.1 Intracellular proteinase inhibitor [Natronorubrum texcoconense]
MSLEGRLEADVSGPDGESELVTFAFTVINRGPESVDLQFSDACKAEFVVEEDGREVWRFSEGRMFAQMLSTDRLEAGAAETYEAEWTAPQPGGYIVRAELQAREQVCAARTDFAVSA